jgi:hypothetical protein
MIIFLSYSKEDTTPVSEIYKELKKAGYQPWMDTHDISPGQNWKFEIQKAISNCNAAVIFLSSKSVSKTGYVQVELTEFLEQRKRRPEGSIYVIPVRLDPCPVPTHVPIQLVQAAQSPREVAGHGWRRRAGCRS